jgi:hypothetical protein
MGPKITGPGSSDVGAVGETWVRASPHGSPRLTWRSLDRGERRRLKLTRQNGKGNCGIDVRRILLPPPGAAFLQNFWHILLDLVYIVP